MDNDWFEDHDRLSEDQKKILYSELKNFDEYAGAIYQEEDLNEIAAKFEAITEYAKRYLNEQGDSFDQVTINRNIKEIEKKVRKFKKEAEKVQKHKERLTALYDDIGVKFNRYFEVGQASEESKEEINEVRKMVRNEIKKLL